MTCLNLSRKSQNIFDLNRSKSYAAGFKVANFYQVKGISYPIYFYFWMMRSKSNFKQLK
jgi:hypothetical protein